MYGAKAISTGDFVSKERKEHDERMRKRMCRRLVCARAVRWCVR